MTIDSSFLSLSRRGMYICRGCGAEIATPSSFRKCPVCGIVWS